MTKGNFYRHAAYGQVYCDEPLLTPIGRFSWPSLVTPKEPPPPMEGQAPGAPRYEVTILLPKTDKAVQEFVDLINSKVDQMTPIFNDKRPAKVTFGEVVQDGDNTDAFDPEKYPFYAGNWVITARNQQKPQVFNAKKEVWDPSKILGGMRGKIVVTPFLHGTGVKYKLQVVQFVSDDGTRFGGGTRDMSSILEACDDDGNAVEANDTSDENGTTTAEVSTAQAAPETKTVSAKDLRAQAAARAKGVQKGKNAAVDLL